MRFRYGSFWHPTGEITSCRFTARQSNNDRGKAQIITRRISLTGMIVASGQAAIDARVAAIMVAYSSNRYDAQMMRSDGSGTTQALWDSSSISGVKVVEPPSFGIDPNQAHFATGLPFSIALEADYLYSDTDPLMSYSETIRVDGDGGPVRVVRPVDFGQWVEQIVANTSPVIISQTGEAVGSLAYPVPNAPIYPARILNPFSDKTIEEMTPQLMGRLHMGYPVRWAYRMTFTTPPSVSHPELR